MYLYDDIDETLVAEPCEFRDQRAFFAGELSRTISGRWAAQRSVYSAP